MPPKCHHPIPKACPFRKGERCLGVIGHHEYWPRPEYKSPLEIAFRGLAVNIKRIPKCIENTIHQNKPPEKPPALDMALEVGLDRYPEDEEERMRIMGNYLLEHLEFYRTDEQLTLDEGMQRPERPYPHDPVMEDGGS